MRDRRFRAASPRHCYVTVNFHPDQSGRNRRRLSEHNSSEREEWAEALARSLDGPVTVLGVIFLLLVVAETVSRPAGTVGTVFQVLSWLIWAVFVAEFVLRAIVAPSVATFLRRNWWHAIFLLVPFLRFARGIRAFRAARVGRVVGSAVRSTRTAGRRLTSRLAWLAATTVIVVLAGSQILYEAGFGQSYGEALYVTALATIAGEPFAAAGAVQRAVELFLATYSVVVFAGLAGSIGAFLLERAPANERRDVDVDDGHD